MERLTWFLRGILIFGFLIIVARLLELQVVKGVYFRKLAEENRIKKIKIVAPRGRILARGGEEVVGERKAEGWVRDYKLGIAAAHLTGYLGEISQSEIGKVDPKCPEKGPKKLGELTGRAGLEEEYNCLLSGIDGEELIEVDTSGKKLRSLGKQEPTPGQDLRTSIDFNLQKKVAEAMAGKKGATIITDPQGEILAFYSSPSFDPNVSVEGLLSNRELPLFDRAIGGLYHPGSVFKPIVATAALEEDSIDKNFVFNDPGVITVNKFSYYNWYFKGYGRTEGTIGLVRAVARSTDTFFYKLGELTGVEKLAFWADRFGLARETGIDLPGEISGLVPTPEWKMRVKGEPWFLGNTYHMSIGQGDIALTPLGVNSAVVAIANGGKLCQPRIGMGLGEAKCSDLKVKDENLDLVKQGMIEACRTGGTGFTFFDFKPQVACKTGTAETSLEGSPHAWFVVFAPADSPEIVATVLVEKGGEGSRVAGPIAREILDFWSSTRQ